MTQPRRWQRWLFAVLAMLLFIAVALGSLATGLWFGAAVVQRVAESLQLIAAGAEGGSRPAQLTADILHTAGTSFRFLPTGVVVLTAMQQRGLPTVFGKVIDDVATFFTECVSFAFGTQPRAGSIRAAGGACFRLAVAASLVGSFGAAPTSPPPDPPPPVTYVISAGPALHLLPAVHFDNAEIGADGALTGAGTTLDDARRTTLETVVRSLLLPCEGRQVTITPYGFASDDEFQGVSKKKSDWLNTEAANRRASAVYAVLQKFSDDVGGLTIEPPDTWAGFEEMKTRRDSMVRVPTDGKLRASRTVVLHLTSADACRLPEPAS